MEFFCTNFRTNNIPLELELKAENIQVGFDGFKIHQDSKFSHLSKIC